MEVVGHLQAASYIDIVSDVTMAIDVQSGWISGWIPDFESKWCVRNFVLGSARRHPRARTLYAVRS
jgi:hypothetical protein